MTYRREIDGLRALAVIPVILFHAGLSPFGGGFVGVDIFFVISGYLISSIILMEKDAETFSLLNFYERRARRILPALFLVILVCIPFVWHWMLPAGVKSFSQSVLAVVTFSSNILFWKQTGYFQEGVELKPLLHTWSLAVEEQYYLLFPLFILVVWRLKKNWMAISLATLAVLSLAAAQWQAYQKPSTAFFLLPTRAWELILGALLAFYMRTEKPYEVPRNLNQIASLIGLAFILFAIFFFNKDTPFPSLFALVPTLGAALIIYFAKSETFVGKLLGTKILVGIGMISYSAYLWHQPVFTFARLQSSGELNQLVSIGISLLIMGPAYLSWKYVENPFRSKIHFNRRSIFVSAALVSLILATFGAAGHFTNGFENYYLKRLNADEVARYRLLTRDTGKDLYGQMFDNNDCQFWSRRITDGVTKRFDQCVEKYGKALIILGDSHAMNIYNIVAKTGAHPFILGVSVGGCRPHDNRPTCHYDAFDSFLKGNRDKIQTVVFNQSGSYLLEDRFGKVDSRLAFQKDSPFIFANEKAEKVISYLKKLSLYTKVIWMGPFVESRVDFSNYKVLSEDLRISEKVFLQFGLLERELKKMVQPHLSSFVYISLVDLLKITPDFLLTDSCITYNDVDHFSSCGENLLAKMFRGAILLVVSALRHH